MPGCSLSVHSVVCLVAFTQCASVRSGERTIKVSGMIHAAQAAHVNYLVVEQQRQWQVQQRAIQMIDPSRPCVLCRGAVS